MHPALTHFHTTVSDWFDAKFATPTLVQTEAWPVIANGDHALVTAPTGSGKTLTAFLAAIDRFARGEWRPGRTSVLYVSPLKALNTDIHLNLLEPLHELGLVAGFPRIRVATRSGDTSQSDRQRMFRQPPDILITTPESLTLLLTSTKGQFMLSDVRTVIVDEVHALADSRRGVALAAALERVVDLAGEVQRVALSATVNPLETVARFIGGYDDRGLPRDVRVIAPTSRKAIELAVRYPPDVKAAIANGTKIWEPLADTFRSLIQANRSTLLFTNSRRMAEKITLRINDGQAAPLAYAHHGSLARDIRQDVEVRLKEGSLKAIVATSSLEMGIDIGDLDHVALIQSPPSVAATLQRIGRAGHQVGAVSRATLFPTHAQDFVEAAVLCQAVERRDLEPVRTLAGPLDVLAQVLISMSAHSSLNLDDAYRSLQRAAPYQTLSREHFDLVVDMLAGRYAGSRVRELKPRVEHDRIRNTIRASRGALFALYNSGGTIVDRGYFQLRHADTGSLIGELDEEFVWEATTGQTFSLGTQTWQIQRITHNDVMVRAAPKGATAPPFWRSETFNRNAYFSERMGEYLRGAEEALARNAASELAADLQALRFDDTAAEETVDYLERQRAATGTPLPHRHHLLIERVRAGPAGYRGPDDPHQLIIHTLWGGTLNRPWALALQTAWRSRFPGKPDIHADNNCVVIQLKEAVSAADVLAMVTVDNFDALLRASLESSNYFGARFRECAGRSLLLTRKRFNERLPLWMSRLQAKKLMTATRRFSDFPVLLEAWRTCLQDEFDIDALKVRLTELEHGDTAWSYVESNTPSPFAQNVTFDQLNRYMYADDVPEVSGASALGADLVHSVSANDALRPRIEREIVDAYVAKRQRRAPGYEPASADELASWIKERVLTPVSECPADYDHNDIIKVRDHDREWLVHRELVHMLAHGDWRELLEFELADPIPVVDDPRTATDLAIEVLSFYGPLSRAQIDTLLPGVPDGLLDDAERYVHGQLVDDESEPLWCDADNFETLLRFQRAARRPNLEAQPLARWPAFVADWQQFNRRADEYSILDTADTLRGYPAPVSVWLHDLFAARLTELGTADPWARLEQHDLVWYGVGREAISADYADDCFTPTPAPADIATLFRDPHARYTFAQVRDRQPDTTLGEFNERWWQAVWSGHITSGDWRALADAEQRRYALSDNGGLARGRVRRPRARVAGWRGAWFLLPERSDCDDNMLDQLESNKERVRGLLERYGFVCRELVNRDERQGSWRALFTALRLMELSGEVTAGYFFQGFSGPQFLLPGALSLMRETQADGPRRSFWISACDPAAPSGLGLDWPAAPPRRAGNYLAFDNGELALVARNYGAHIRFVQEPTDASIATICAPLTHILSQRSRITVQTIDDEPAKSSRWVGLLGTCFRITHDHKHLYLEN